MAFILLNTLIIGIIYSLIAISYNVIYKTSRIINFSQGEFVVFSGVLWAFLTDTYHISPFISGIVTLFFGIFVSSFLYLGILMFIRKNIIINSIPITLSYGAILQALSGFFLSTDLLNVDIPFLQKQLSIGNFKISYLNIFIFITTFLFLFLLHFTYKRTLVGIKLRAVSEDYEKSILKGISPSKIILFAFILSGFISSLAGILITPINGIRYDQGFVYAIKGFAALIIGGIGNIWGSLLGGFLLSFIENFSIMLSPETGEIVIYICIILFLIFKPYGLLKEK